MLEQSALDSWLRDTERDPAERPASDQNGSEPSLDPFIPRRGRGLMLSASDIDTYRICPLKYKFARVFRIPRSPPSTSVSGWCYTRCWSASIDKAAVRSPT